MEERMQTIRRWNDLTKEYDCVSVSTGKFKFTEEDKIAIVAEYVSGHLPASQIIEKYHISSRQVFFNWMDKYVNEKELVSFLYKSR